MKIAITPFDSTYNKYIELTKIALSEIDSDIEVVDFDKINDNSLNEIDYVVLNWFESIYSKNLLKIIYKFTQKMIILKKLNKARVKIIWICHNKVPHDKKSRPFSKYLMKYLIKKSHRIIIHCYESKEILENFISPQEMESKITHIPHPNYIGIYDTPSVNHHASDKLKLLFVGQIKPYKNVDLLIKVFKELNLSNVELTICGKTMNQQYEKYIMDLIGNNQNIITNFGFMSDENLISEIIKHDLLVLPYDLESSLNSGTIILAFSNKRTVLSPNIGTLKDMESSNDFFSYMYMNAEEHEMQLKEKLLEVVSINQKNPNKILELGEKCYTSVKQKNNLDIVIKGYQSFIK